MAKLKVEASSLEVFVEIPWPEGESLLCLLTHTITPFPRCAGGPSFASKPTTPTGMGGGFPPSPQKPSPQPMGSSWQQGAGYGWQQAQPKAQPGMPHASPQNKPNYNVSFSAMPGAQNERGKGPANAGKHFRIQRLKGWLFVMLL